MVDGTVSDGRYSAESTPDYFSGNIRKISDDEFEKIYGRSLPQNGWNGQIHMNDAVCQLYYGKGILGKLICFGLKHAISVSKNAVCQVLICCLITICQFEAMRR